MSVAALDTDPDLPFDGAATASHSGDLLALMGERRQHGHSERDTTALGARIMLAVSSGTDYDVAVEQALAEVVQREPIAAPGIRFMSAAELRRTTPDEPDWLWDGYIASGWLTLLGGKPKAGKSTLQSALVEACVSRAASFLGRAVSGGPVVVVTEEGAVTALNKLPASDDVRILVREHAWPKPKFPELIAAAVDEAERVGAKLLVVDSFAFWAQLGADAEKDAGAVQLAMAPLLEAASAGLAPLLICHQRKAPGDGGDALRGSGAIAANADMILEYERMTGDTSPHQRQLLAVGRWSSTPPLLVVDYDPQEASWRVVGEGQGRGDCERFAWRERLTAALPPGEPGTTYAELSELVGAQKAKWLGELNALIADGTIQTAGDGKRGSPKRFWRAADSVPTFRSEPETERNGNADLFPFSVIENGNGNSIQQTVPAAVTETDNGDLDADCELDRLTDKFPDLFTTADGSSA
jgi:hypothetical protein